MYVFGVVVHHGERSLQALSDRHLYVWLENQNRKDSNMIASALDHCLRTSLAEDVQQAGSSAIPTMDRTRTVQWWECCPGYEALSLKM